MNVGVSQFNDNFLNETFLNFGSGGGSQSSSDGSDDNASHQGGPFRKFRRLN